VNDMTKTAEGITTTYALESIERRLYVLTLSASLEIY